MNSPAPCSDHRGRGPPRRGITRANAIPSKRSPPGATQKKTDRSAPTPGRSGLPEGKRITHMNTTFAGARLQGLRRCWGCGKWGHPDRITWDAAGAPDSRLLWPEGTWQYYCSDCRRPTTGFWAQPRNEWEWLQVCERVCVPKVIARAFCARNGINFDAGARESVAVAALVDAIKSGIWPAWGMATCEAPRLPPAAAAAALPPPSRWSRR